MEQVKESKTGETFGEFTGSVALGTAAGTAVLLGGVSIGCPPVLVGIIAAGTAIYVTEAASKHFENKKRWKVLKAMEKKAKELKEK